MPDYKTVEDVIGATPLVRLQRLAGEEAARRGNVIVMVGTPVLGIELVCYSSRLCG